MTEIKTKRYMTAFEKEVLAAIRNGCGSPIELQNRFGRADFGAQKASRKLRVNQFTGRQSLGSQLELALRRLRHMRRIKFNQQARRYEAIDRITYHPPEPMEKLIERHRKSRPDVSLDVLLL